ncbi:hypothetical protein ASPWEDRAFT_362245 [Aspergillus wentii DTO 134E9]|uniref:Uncharacterized protein n=1 Tax=Aspergillus wentii DTO 134E9 TaxID=1073089 RepID=A0A1L9RWH5_ASPWE|nr:uncharacterized protein ASPWEDRAFT_362245 [Aspergillus wentii DTO 134E9]KAI9929088.1 hypothetical protein MW887_001492 [Aspergillus wentii]OJJ39217.1 hypothetical protein ASPWEDRAFT_362245 [Aspergillus wentii DTO 134E9]
MEDIRPTAKWANRMLRPLASIYRRLEKHQETLSIVTNSKPKEKLEGCDAETTRVSTASEAEESFSFSDGEPDDPAWVPGKTVKRRIRHKYSSRAEVSKGTRKRSRLSLRSPELQKTLPGAIEIATPLITGKTRGLFERTSARKQLFKNDLSSTSNAGPSDGRRPGRPNNTSYPAYRGSWKEALDLSGDTRFADIAHVLDRIFIRFLNSTRVPDGKTPKVRGARSLLSMATRCLPEFIAEEQREQDESEEVADVDMCDAYFTELETHYAPHGNGWQPLREAVRAQGIHLVSEMLVEKWVSQLAGCRLLYELLSQGEHGAFESILSRFLSTINTYDYPTSFDPPRPASYQDPVQLLNHYYLRFPLRRSFVFDELAKLLLRKAFAPEWMVTNMWKHYVDGAINSLSADDDESAAATRLIEAVILSAGNISPSMDASANLVSRGGVRPARGRDTRTAAMSIPGLPQDQSPCPIPIQDALSNLTLSLITALGGMHISRSQTAAAEERIASMKVRNIVSYLAFTVQREIDIRAPSCKANVPTYQSLRHGSVLLSNYLLQCNEEGLAQTVGQSDSISTNVESFFESLSDRADVIKELAVLAQQVFRCCERGQKRDQTYTSLQVRNKVSQLAQLSIAGGLGMFLGKVATETAMGFAETTADPDDHVWAVEIQERVVSSQREQESEGPAVHEQHHSDGPSGLYRWEDSIGEWVQRTPGSKAKATGFEIGSRQLGSRPSIPSTIACSTNSSPSTSAPSEDSASSIASSPPTVPIKRTLPDRRSAPRSSKRLRLGPVEVYTDGADSPHDSASPTSNQLPKWNSTATAAKSRPRRGVLRELTQAKNKPPQVIDNGAKSTTYASKVQVVIFNKAAQDTVEDVQRGNPQPNESPEACISVDQRKTELPRSWTVPAPRQRMVIPCSEDSDDELSFL